MSENESGKALTKSRDQHEDLEEILTCAVVVSWDDLMRDRSGLIHVEYDFAPDATLDHLKIWSSIRRGYWLLACTYWMSASESHDAGVRFDNGYQSKGLAHILDVVMQHQKVFGLPHNSGRPGLLQIVKPTETQSKAAADSISNALDRSNSPATPMFVFPAA